MKPSNLARLLLSCVAFAAMLALGACNNTGTGSITDPSTKVCADFNNKQDECEKNSEQGKKCVYDVADNTCSPEGTREACGKLDPEACKDEAKCWLDAGNKCIPIGNKAGTCAAHQRQAVCDADATKCEWDGNECIDKPQVTDIFTWKKMNLPVNTTIAQVDRLKVTGNEQHLYLYRKAADDTDPADVAAKGIYHSSDAGTTWEQLGNGVLTGRPFVNASGVLHPEDVTLDCKVDQPKLVPTQDGLVAYLNGKIIVISGNEVEWALDTAVHNNGYSILNPKKVLNGTANVRNEPISFVRVVTTQAGESVLFGQQSANTVLMHKVGDRTSRTSRPLSFKTRKTDGTDLNQVWTMAGNTYNNQGVLLASAEGLWEFPLANTDAANAADFGKTSSDTAVLFPEPAGAGVNWVDNNVSYTFVGSFDNNGTAHYFAGLNHDAARGAAGGFAHHNGIQTMGKHAELILSGGSVISITYAGAPRLTYVDVVARTGDALKGINNDGTLNPANNLDLRTYAANKNHKQVDGSAVEAFTDTDNLEAILMGNSNKSILWLPSKGVYIISKSQGQPRP